MYMHEELLELAIERRKAVNTFYYHVILFIFGNAILAVLDVILDPSWWFYWITLIWGVVLIWHGYFLYSRTELFGHQWEKQKIEELKEQDKWRR
jgi:hypothetical protein